MKHNRKNPAPSYGRIREVKVCDRSNPEITYTVLDGQDQINNGHVSKAHQRHLNKHGTSFGQTGALSGVRVGAGVGYSFSNGHRGMAQAVAGAKKFVRSRIRHHENAATKRLARDLDTD